MERHRHLFTIFLIVTATVSIGSLIFFISNKNIVPDWDMVSTIHFLTGQGSGNALDWLSWDVLEIRDNEHRPYFPMIIWGIDGEFFNFSGHFSHTISFLFIALTSHFATSWRNQPSWSTTARLLIFFSAFCLMLSPMHWVNLIWEKQVHVYASTFFAVLAFVTFERAIGATSTRKRYLQIFLSSLCALISTFSFAYGLIIWPVLLAYGMLRRRSIAFLLSILIPSLITIGLYFSTYKILGHHSDPLESLWAIGSLLTYSLRFLGAPFIAIGLGDWAALSIATGSLCLIAWAIWQVFSSGQRTTSTHGASLMIAVFCIGVALLTGLGRLTINTGADSRYLVIAALYLLATPGLLLPWIEAKRLHTPLAWSFASICLALNIVMHFDYSDLRGRQLLIREGVIAAAMDVEPLKRGLHPVTAIINEDVWPYFFYRNRDAKSLHPLNWLGEKLPHAVGPAPTGHELGCIGAVAAVRPRSVQPGYVTVNGWARWGQRGERASTWILVTDDAFRLVGMGTSGVKRQDVRETLRINIIEDLFTDAKRAGFTGQAKAKPGDRLNFYAYKDGQVCQFAESRPVPAS